MLREKTAPAPGENASMSSISELFSFNPITALYYGCQHITEKSNVMKDHFSAVCTPLPVLLCGVVFQTHVFVSVCFLKTVKQKRCLHFPNDVVNAGVPTHGKI